jgi:hypothetical protein
LPGAECAFQRLGAPTASETGQGTDAGRKEFQAPEGIQPENSNPLFPLVYLFHHAQRQGPPALGGGGGDMGRLYFPRHKSSPLIVSSVKNMR